MSDGLCMRRIGFTGRKALPQKVIWQPRATGCSIDELSRIYCLTRSAWHIRTKAGKVGSLYG